MWLTLDCGLPYATSRRVRSTKNTPIGVRRPTRIASRNPLLVWTLCVDTMPDSEEYQLDQEIRRLQEQLLKAKADEKNLEIAIKILEERELIDSQFRSSN